MKIYAINYANKPYVKAQKLNTRTAYQMGADKVFAFSPEDIDEIFKKEHVEILSAPRGNGYWLWKPYFIKRVLATMEEGDGLVYADAGIFYLNSLPRFFENMKKENKWLCCQETGFLERKYTKRDAFVYMGLDIPEYTDTIQRTGTVVLIKCEKAICFVEEWLHYACNPHIITDRPNACGKENYEDFIDHRHDQSIFSLLTKKYRIDPEILFENFELRKKSNALLCYHHSMCGNVLTIALYRKYMDIWYNFKEIIKKIIRYHK